MTSRRNIEFAVLALTGIIFGLPTGCVPYGCKCGHVALPPHAGREAEPMTLEQVWSIDGFFLNAAIDPQSGDIIGLRQGAPGARRQHPDWGWDGRIYRVTPGGKVLSVTTVGGTSYSPTFLCVARLGHDNAVGYVVTGMDSVVDLFDDQGTLLWDRLPAPSIKDVAAVDLDDDGTDELVVASAGGGVVALNADGSKRWSALDDEWVWSVVPVPDTCDGKSRIAAGGLSSAVTTLKASGGVVRRIPFRLSPMGLGVDSGDPAAGCTVIVAEAGRLQMQSAGLNGEPLWCMSDPATARAFYVDMAVSSRQHWAAVSLKTGDVYVYDLCYGRRLASRSDPATAGYWQHLNWIADPDGGSDLLIEATGHALKAFRVRPKQRHEGD